VKGPFTGLRKLELFGRFKPDFVIKEVNI